VVRTLEPSLRVVTVSWAVIVLGSKTIALAVTVAVSQGVALEVMLVVNESSRACLPSIAGTAIRKCNVERTQVPWTETYILASCSGHYDAEPKRR
jgi:hypothetical protein